MLPFILINIHTLPMPLVILHDLNMSLVVLFSSGCFHVHAEKLIWGVQVLPPVSWKRAHDHSLSVWWYYRARSCHVSKLIWFLLVPKNSHVMVGDCFCLIAVSLDVLEKVCQLLSSTTLSKCTCKVWHWLREMIGLILCQT